MMFRTAFVMLLLALSFMTLAFHPPAYSGFRFLFKGQEWVLRFPLRGHNVPFFPRARRSNAQLDTLSTCYWVQRRYVEIIRQNEPTEPRLGLALAFEFDEEAQTYPYIPDYAILQLKDFRWGGVEFDQRDTFNYTGVSNEISDDIQVAVDSFKNDTLYGRFSGLLLSGSDQMGALEDGVFAVKVYRK